MDVQHGLYDARRAPAVERLARIEGQSNFLSLLAGVEAGPDTTEDMGALAFSRSRGAIPEVLEAHMAQSELFKLPLMSIVFEVVKREFAPEPKESPWIQGAIADAFLLVRSGTCKAVEPRARRFRVDKAAYGAMRKLAHGVLMEMVARAERGWYQARIRSTPADRHNEGVEGANHYGMARGCYRAPPLPTDQDGEALAFDARAIGREDRLGWDERNAAPGPVIESSPSQHSL